MEIVVLDGYCLNHGDLDWSAFEALGSFSVYDRTPYDKIVERMGSAEIMITNKCTIDEGVLEKPYSTESVVQSVFGLILELYIGIGSQSASVKRGDWAKAPDFCYYPVGLRELSGKTLGIIGYGSIGRRVKEVALAFGMKVIVNTRTKRVPEDGFRYVTREELFSESDIVTLHCPLTDENKGMINSAAISLMKPGAIIINTARGGLIVSSELCEALKTGRIAGAGLDVAEREPPAADDPLIAQPNVIVTPHTAWATHEARERLMKKAALNLEAFLKGNPLNVV